MPGRGNTGIESRQLVPGDLVIPQTGCQIPADIRLTESVNLKAEESALTGESVPVLKKKGDLVCQSSYVTYGRGAGIVEATGMDTAIGRIASSLKEKTTALTPLQRKLAELGKVLSAGALAYLFPSFWRSAAAAPGCGEMFLTAISLAVAAVPEGLPAIVTIVLALSVSRMVRVHTIVRKLPAVETLGAVTAVCSDKTGTLTQNKMKVVSCYTGGEIRGQDELRRGREDAFLDALNSLAPMCMLGEDADGKYLLELALLDLAEQYSVRKERTGEGTAQDRGMAV